MLQPTLRFLAVVASIRACSEVDGCMCRNDRRQCAFVDDGECDDGGPGAAWRPRSSHGGQPRAASPLAGSDSGSCALGQDCNDCGERRDGQDGGFLCKNRCGVGTSNGHCDDGGPGARRPCAESVLNDVNDWAIEEASLDHDASTEMFERDPDGRME